MGVYPGVFVKSAEVVLNVEVGKMNKNKSLEVVDKAGFAGVRVAGSFRTRRLSYFTIA
jgi:hypothetical protein